MKKTILFSLLMVIAFCAYSQDYITQTSGEKIKCKITRVDSLNIYFTMVQNGQEIKTFIDKYRVQNVQYGEYQIDNSNPPDEMEVDRNCLTFGFLEGGGSLFGFDFEIRLSDYIGIQAGVGFIGYGGGLNIHLKPSVRSSFFSFQYLHQGTGESFTQSVLGPCYVYRGKKWFTAQLGVGFMVENGPAFPEDMIPPTIMLTYAIGVYIPW